MSVMLVSAAQINAITSWAALRAPLTPAHVGGHWVKFGTDRPRIARELHRANAEAFSARYGDRVDPCAFEPALLPAASSMTPGQVCRLLDSLEYNSDEAPGWKESDAYGHCQQLRRALCEHLQGYTAAAWTIDSPDQVLDAIGIAA